MKRNHEYSLWEMRLFGLVKTGERENAIHFLQETRNLKREEAAKRVEVVAAKLGVK